MRAWQRLDATEKPTSTPTDATAMIGKMYHAFAASPRFWRALGARRPGVCQFAIPGAKLDHWYVALDASGARLARGAHPSPSATFRADATAFLALMRGEAGAELFDAGRVALTGDLGLLGALFEGLKTRS
ncbi:SCP2 sterol-binding domain-containing protein [Myxococcota bacterium]|nr:SCP2 sterol-binding domain-containing protein [Myxococcota bacterium]